ncbi:hypothetical protein [Yinghuangia seranimata]|uniref:hypothetical protein n=1 Tax=Yinghuangia seranimata TaxID=408067 RepID=UPI00248AA395|nr:hypothetical protein [Yinghuangia seranimata]MDI2128018.1 hypothetical protein [Yinghuangia seranimata]
MPTPHGDHGLAFSMPEVAVLRRALRLAMKAAPGADAGMDAEDAVVGAVGPAGSAEPAGAPAPAPVDYWLLDAAIAEAESERARLRAFHLAELASQRAALPGAATTYLAALDHAVTAYGHTPTAEDLAALRTLNELPCGDGERDRRLVRLIHFTALAERELDDRLTAEARERDAG